MTKLPERGAAGAMVALCAAGFLLSGCMASAIGAGALGAAQTRSMGAVIDDTTIQLALNRDFAVQMPGFVSRIGTEVHEGRVLIAGTVQTPEQRVEASRIAWRVRGVRDVVNELQVADSQSLGDYMADARISNQMRLRLLTASGVREVNYDIETVNRTVYILGVARNREELEHVAHLAATIAGVRNVVSHAYLMDDQRRLKRPHRATERTRS